jgi:TolB-like protein
MSDAPKAVFLSYAREDSEAARRIADALRAFGVEVWFDRSELRGGDAWDQKIRTQIKECALFVPVISARTQDRGEGYFRLEWKLAAERTHLMAEGVPFLAPVVVDATTESAAAVPVEFMRVHWSRLPGALPTPEFVETIKRLLTAPRIGAAGASNRGASADQAAGAEKSWRPAQKWALVVAIVAALGTAVFVAQRSRAPATGPIAAAPLADDKSIAVLPFENRSADKEANATFTDGIHEDILTSLQHVRELRVVSRTSVEQYRGTKKSMPLIARELGVTFLLEGSVQREGNTVRVTGQLIHGPKDQHLWANRYDRNLTDIFAIQSEVAEAIAGELKAAISPAEKSLLNRRPTDNLAAYELYLKARTSNNRENFAPGVAQNQEAWLQAAVEMDPKFAAAWGALGALHARFYFNYLDQTAARQAKARVAIDRAVSLAPDLPDVIAAVGRYHYLAERNYAKATEQFQRVLRTEPNSIEAWQYLGVIQRSEGRWLDALASNRKAVQLDPRSIVDARNFIGTLRMGRRWEEARAEARRLVAIDPELVASHFLLAQVAFAATGSVREFEDVAAFYAKSHPSEKGVLKMMAEYRGDFEEYLRLDREEPYWNEGPAPRVQALAAAEMYFALGRIDAARARLENHPVQIRARLESEPANSALWQALSRMEVILGHNDEGLRCALKATEQPAARDAFDGPAAWANLIIVRTWIGEKDRALADLADFLRRPSYATVHTLRRSVALSPLRGDPRFEALLSDPKNNAPLF